jgi:hypothetical protein
MTQSWLQIVFCCGIASKVFALLIPIHATGYGHKSIVCLSDLHKLHFNAVMSHSYSSTRLLSRRFCLQNSTNFPLSELHIWSVLYLIALTLLGEMYKFWSVSLCLRCFFVHFWKVQIFALAFSSQTLAIYYVGCFLDILCCLKYRLLSHCDRPLELPSTPDIARPSLSTHESMWTEIVYYLSIGIPWYRATPASSRPSKTGDTSVPN